MTRNLVEEDSNPLKVEPRCTPAAFQNAWVVKGLASLDLVDEDEPEVVLCNET